MSEHEQDDYPPNWDAPPRLGFYDGEGLTFLKVRRALEREWPATWVAEHYLQKIERGILMELEFGFEPDLTWSRIAARHQEHFPNDPFELGEEELGTLRFLLEHVPERSPEEQEALRFLINQR